MRFFLKSSPIILINLTIMECQEISDLLMQKMGKRKPGLTEDNHFIIAMGFH